jgi:hypothetical protein
LLSVPLGASAGVFLCVVAECNSARPYAASMLLGAGAGVALSALVTRYTGLEFSTAQAIEGGAIWGTTTPLYLWMLSSSSHDERGLFFGLAAGELLGAGLGGLIERRVRPSSGAVALAISGSLWLSSIATLLAFTVNPNIDSSDSIRALGGGLLAAQALGLGLGGLLGQRFEASRAQVWLADAGAVVLGGTMPLLAWLVAGYEVTPEAMLGSTAAGMGLGFATAYLLAEFLPRRELRAAERATRHIERLRLGMLPVRGGGGLSLSARLL